jgi:hypothetical protein
MRILLDCDGINVNLKCDVLLFLVKVFDFFIKMTPLHIAVRLKNIQAVVALLADRFIDVNIQNDVF